MIRMAIGTKFEDENHTQQTFYIIDDRIGDIVELTIASREQATLILNNVNFLDSILNALKVGFKELET